MLFDRVETTLVGLVDLGGLLFSLIVGIGLYVLIGLTLLLIRGLELITLGLTTIFRDLFLIEDSIIAPCPILSCILIVLPLRPLVYDTLFLPRLPYPVF
tara:strand:+ start:184 stop:480 length:297 start_codon:yes stop_codon:yes gene_type:complete